MPRLILLNGPPAAGKSSLARRFVAEHPLTLNLDLDLVRSLLGRWQDDWLAAGLLARELALVMARTHLLAGHDVIVPQLIADPEYLDRIEALAVDATFHEVVLLAGRDELNRRFAERADPASELSMGCRPWTSWPTGC
jgi:predicted kinase